MPLENPTGGDAGASIQERLESFLAAEDSPEPEQTANGNAGAEGELEFEGTDNDGQPAADANAETDDQPESDELKGDQQPQMTTADFAKVLGIDESMLDLDEEGNAIIKTKIDGKEGSAKFADVLKSYQLQGHIDNKAREVAEQQKAMQQRMAEAEQAVQQRIQHIEALATAAQQELTREFQSVDWNWLRENNPGEYAARLQDYQTRSNQLQNMLGHVDQQKAQAKQQEDQRVKQLVAKAESQLPVAIPEWRDMAVAQKQLSEVTKWAIDSGIEPEAIKAVFGGHLANANHIAALRKAMLYDQLQTSKKTVENKVRTAPKLVKPGQAQAQSREQVTVRNLKDNIRKSGGKSDAVAAYLLAAGKA